MISFFIVLYKKHKVCFIIGKIINNSRNPSANIQEGQQRGLAVGTGQGGRRQTGSGAGTDVSVMGSTPAGCWEQSRLLMAGQKVTATKGDEGRGWEDRANENAEKHSRRKGHPKM